jgi:hypothetical protein
LQALPLYPLGLGYVPTFQIETMRETPTASQKRGGQTATARADLRKRTSRMSHSTTRRNQHSYMARPHPEDETAHSDPRRRERAATVRHSKRNTGVETLKRLLRQG